MTCECASAPRQCRRHQATTQTAACQTGAGCLPLMAGSRHAEQPAPDWQSAAWLPRGWRPMQGKPWCRPPVLLNRPTAGLCRQRRGIWRIVVHTTARLAWPRQWADEQHPSFGVGCPAAMNLNTPPSRSGLGLSGAVCRLAPLPSWGRQWTPHAPHRFSAAGRFLEWSRLPCLLRVATPARAHTSSVPESSRLQGFLRQPRRPMHRVGCGTRCSDPCR